MSAIDTLWETAQKVILWRSCCLERKFKKKKKVIEEEAAMNKDDKPGMNPNDIWPCLPQKSMWVT